MAGLRRSTRLKSSSSPSQPSTSKSAAGTKRKTETGSPPAAKRGKSSTKKEQKTLEETIEDSKSALTTAEKEDAQLAEVIEKSKTETNQNTQDVQNGDLQATQKEEDTKMEDAPVHTDAPADDLPKEERPKQDAKMDDPVKDDTAKEDVARAMQPQPETAKFEAPKTEPAHPETAGPHYSKAMPFQPYTVQSEPTHTVASSQSATSGTEAPKDAFFQRKSADSDTIMDRAAEEKPTEPSVATNGTSHDAKTNDVASKADSSATVEPKEPAQHINGDTAVEPKAREEEVPASIMEKGIIYFFFRGRVGVENPHEVNDIARTYMVMRPLPHGAKLGEGPIGDSGNCRLLALPKKVLPLSGKDRFLIFVEKAKTSFDELKKNVMPGSDYETQTAGVRHTPAMTPVGEAVYAITSTGRESHLAYILTIPSELSDVQKDIGLRERGSFVVSAKNPQYSGPANASLPQGANYSQDILEEFKNLRWMPLKPKLLDYANTQFLIIGESSGLEHATEAQPGDEKEKKETPLEEMEKLEGEDEIRVKHLKGDDAIFADLHLSKTEYPKVPSTW